MADETPEDVQGIADPIERTRRAVYWREHYADLERSFARIRQEGFDELRRSGMTQSEIGKAVGLSRARVGQLLTKGGPPVERALLAPNLSEPIRLAVVQKVPAEKGPGASGGPQRAEMTIEAVGRLKDYGKSAGLGFGKDISVIEGHGMIDLDQENLVVLVGPRISVIVELALAKSDPVIRWHKDQQGCWYLTDTKTGAEYHSDFDQGWQPQHDEVRTCVAHIGRIRRPDGRGGFLYLGGAHAPGTAGAVSLFLREIGFLWEQAKRSYWSAVVVTKVSPEGEIVSAELASPVYLDEKR